MPTRKLRSAGLLMYRQVEELQVLLAHPGGPFFARKDAGAWTIPKGEVEPEEDAQQCALREFQEETGIRPGEAQLLHLGEIQQRGGKRVEAWAFAGEWAGGRPDSNSFEIEWPPRSGKKQSFPEIDQLAWFSVSEAQTKLNPAQIAFVERLVALLADR